MKSFREHITETFEISWKNQRRINAISRNLQKRGIDPLAALGNPNMASDPVVKSLSAAAQKKVRRSIQLLQKGIGSYQKVNRQIEDRNPKNTYRRTRRHIQQLASRLLRNPNPNIIDLRPEQQN